LLSGSPATFGATTEPDTAIGITLSSDGKSLYVAQSQCLVGSGAGAVLQYDVSSSGSLTAKSPFQVASGGYMMSLAVSPGAGPPAQHKLTVSVTGSGVGSVTGTGISCPGTCSSSYASGTAVTLTAKPAAGSTFGGWSGGGCSGSGGCTVTLNADETVTATFTAAAPKCTLAVKAKTVILKVSKHKSKHARKPDTLPLMLGCDEAASFTLTGQFLQLAEKHPKTLGMSPIHGRLRAGATDDVTLKLPRGAIGVLEDGHKLKAAFTLVATTSGATGRVTATVRSLSGTG
jgi:hypothetical protein